MITGPLNQLSEACKLARELFVSLESIEKRLEAMDSKLDIVATQNQKGCCVLQ